LTFAVSRILVKVFAGPRSISISSSYLLLSDTVHESLKFRNIPGWTHSWIYVCYHAVRSSFFISFFVFTQ